jgi:Na+-driven multidrug efflux pump
MAVEIILEGAFNGAGDTIPPMMVYLPGSIARLPIAYYLCYILDFGVSGVWWSLTITTWMRGMAMAYWFWLGHWKKTGLIETRGDSAIERI